MKTINILILSIISLSVIAQTYVKKQINIKDFKGIDNTTLVDVKIEKSDKYSLIFETEKENIDRIVFEKKGTSLIIKKKDKKNMKTKHMVLYVKMPNVYYINALGSGDFDIEGDFSIDNFKLNITGSGDVEIEKMLCNNLKANISGSGDLEFEGKNAKNIDLTISGSGDVEFEKIISDNISIIITGSGDVEFSGTTNKLDISLTGSGDVKCRKLKANDVEVNLTGSGDITVYTQNSINATGVGSGDIYLYSDKEIKQNVRMTGSGDFHQN